MATNPQDKDASSASSDVKSFVNSLRAATNEQQRLARVSKKLEDAFETASNAAIDKAAAGMEEIAKQSALLEDAIKEEIKAHKQSPRELVKTMQRLEKYADAVIKEQKEYSDQLKKIAAAKAKLQAQDKNDETVQKKLRALTAKELDLKLDLNTKLKDLGIEVKDAADRIDELAASAKKHKDSITGFAKDLSKPSAQIGKALEGMHSQVQSNIEGFGKFSVVMALAKKAVSELYGQSIRLANKGLVGSMAQMNLSAMKLRMTAEEFEGLVSANRDMVALMGGGAEGISKFEEVIDQSSVGLEYLGKEGKKAAATIMSSFNRAGFGLMSSNEDISNAYRGNIKDLNKQFKMFNGVFGDTAEQFANLYEQQLKSEALQAKMLSGDTKGLALQMKEVMVRTETLKLMGLNNDQIVAMSKRVDSLFNPKENRQGEALSERISARQALMSGANLVQGEDPQLAEKIAKFVQSGEAERYQQLSTEDKKKYQVENAELFKSISKMDEMITAQKDKTGGDYGEGALRANLYTDRAKAAGREFSTMSEFGKDLNQAQAQGYDQSPEGRMKTAAKGFENTLSDVNGETTDLGKAFGRLRDAVDQTTAVFNNPFISALTAIGGALLFSSTTIRTAVQGAATAVMSTAKLMTGSIGGLFKGLFGLFKKISVLSAIFGGLEGAWESFNTDTEDYYKRAGIDQEATVVPQFMKDLGVRLMGTLSDVGSATVKGATFGQVDLSKDFADKQDKPKTTAMSSVAKSNTATQPQSTIVSKPPTAVQPQQPQQQATQGTNGQIAKVLSVAPGSNTVQRPDGTIEKVTGDRNWRNNNPGNIEAGEFANSMGAIGSDGRFAIFPDYETGRKAKASLLFSGKNYKDLSLSDAIARYAPPTENNTAAYQASVLSAVGGQNKKMSDYTDEQQKLILDAMQKVEGFKAGKVTQLGQGQPITPQQTPLSSINASSAMMTNKPSMPLITPQVPPVVDSNASAEVQKRQALLAGAAQSQPNITAQPTAANNGNPVVNELQKHTGLLSTMITLLSRPTASSRAYQLDQQTGFSVAS